MPLGNPWLFLFFTLSSGMFFAVFASFVLAQSKRVEEAWFAKDRKHIRHKWWYLVSRSRSQCDLCDKDLPALFLFPLLGNFYARWSCEQCHKQLSYSYVFMELAAFVYGFVFAWENLYTNGYLFFVSTDFKIFLEPSSTVWFWQFWLQLLLETAFSGLLFHAARIDQKYMLVADANLWALLGVAIGKLFLLQPFAQIGILLFWSLLWLLILLFLQRFFQDKLGMADVFLIPLLITAAGLPQGIFLPLLASFSGILWVWLTRPANSLSLSGAKQQTWTHKKIPFVPFLFFAWLCLTPLSLLAAYFF